MLSRHTLLLALAVLSTVSAIPHNIPSAESKIINVRHSVNLDEGLATHPAIRTRTDAVPPVPPTTAAVTPASVDVTPDSDADISPALKKVFGAIGERIGQWITRVSGVSASDAAPAGR